MKFFSHSISATASAVRLFCRVPRVGPQHDRRSVDAGAWRNLLPDLFGDEGHDRVQQPQQAFQYLDQRPARAAPCCRLDDVVGLQHGFRQLEVPVTELVPGEFVDGLRDEVEPVGIEVPVNGGHRVVESCTNPAVSRAQFDVTVVQLLRVHQHVARCIPELVAEVLVAFDAAQVEADVAAGRGERTRT